MVPMATSGIKRTIGEPNITSRALGALCLVVLALMWAGCNGSSGGGGAPAVSAVPATNSSVIAIDCKRQRAYVPLDFLNENLHGQVAVLDLSVDPDKGDPLVTVIDIGLVALPRAAAVDIKSGTVLVLADNAVTTGTLLLINEADLSISQVSFPTGSRPGPTSGVVVNPDNNTALISMNDAPDCSNSAGCTGEALFDLGTGTFGPLLITSVDVNAFGLLPKTDLTISTSDLAAFLLLVPHLGDPPTLCLLVDQNVVNLDADPDGVGVDPTTDIWVVGNFESPQVSVINLNRSTFNGLGTDACSLDEGGTQPNSVNHDTQVGSIGMPGVGVNPLTHKALITADSSNEIALLSLPTGKVKQLKDSQVKSVHSSIPSDPLGLPFQAAEFPYGTDIDTCHNLGYVIDDFRTFVVQINLAKLQKNPQTIATALPAGSCASLATTSSCDNGHGVKFFPLPTVSGGAATSLPPQFTAGSKAGSAKAAAKIRR